MDGSRSQSEKDAKAPNFFERAKEEIDAMMHREKKHHKETHGTSNDIYADTPIDKVKAPSVFERAKEEIEALVGTLHHKKEHDHEEHLKNGEEFGESLGRSEQKN